MTKRQKFVSSALGLAVCFLILQLASIQARYEILGAITSLSLLLSAWALWEGLRRNATLLTLLLPVLFTAGASLFYFYLLLPSSFYDGIAQFFHAPVGGVRIAGGSIYWLLYAISMYATLLGSNIYNVAAIRTIALLRTAHAVGFLLTVITSFFLFDTVFSFRSFPWINALASLLIVFPLSLQSLWSIELESRMSREVIVFSTVISLGIGEIAFMLSFWPVTITVGSLFLTTILYALLGVVQPSLQGRLFAKTLKEYIFVSIIVFLAVYMSAKWGG